MKTTTMIREEDNVKTRGMEDYLIVFTLLYYYYTTTKVS